MAKSLEEARSDRRRLLQNPYAFAGELEEAADLRTSRRKSENPYSQLDELERLARPVARFDGIPVGIAVSSTGSAKKRYSDSEIKEFVREVHAQIWDNRAQLFPDYRSMRAMEMLDAAAALMLRGYRVEVGGALGQMAGTSGRVSNVAGMIDKASRQVLLSSGLPPVTRNFTLAHELGHAVMHEFSGMHRDKPLDGSSSAGDHQEREADKFAAYFLMPERLLRSTFESIFGQVPFSLNEDTRFALSGSLPSDRWRPRDLRGLTRLISAAARFNGQSIVPLMKQFDVSNEAMAIRLEQLRLVSV